MKNLKKFYFDFEKDEEFPMVYITPKKLYDSEGIMSDENLASEFLETIGFIESGDAAYEFEFSFDEAREILVKAGAIEKELTFGGESDNDE